MIKLWSKQSGKFQKYQAKSTPLKEIKLIGITVNIIIMANKVTIIKNNNGSKKVIIGTRKDNSDAIKSKTIKVSEPIDRRPKPGTPKIVLTYERNGYKYGGKKKYK